MDPIVLNVEDLENAIIPIGKVAENLCTQVKINCKARFDEYPTAVPTLAVTSPSGVKYPVVVTRDGDMVVWDIRNTDLVTEGIGKIQLSFIVDTIVKKSDTAHISIEESILADDPEPDPVSDWLTRAETALGGIPETILESLAQAKASGEFNGPPGADGKDGYTPVKGVDYFDGTPGQDGKDGADGKDGQDGYTPVKGVDYFDGAPGQDGQNGTDGASAYLHIRYSEAQPSSDSDMKTTPDAWIGVYSGESSIAPSHYTDYTWYKFKGETPDISGKADKSDTVLNTTISRGRKANIPVGLGSIAFGDNVTASSNYSVAFGSNTKATNSYATAEGYYTEASGPRSHAEGDTTKASGGSSHSQGYQTIASGYYSHAEGQNTQAVGNVSHAQGKYTYAGENAGNIPQYAFGYNNVPIVPKQVIVGPETAVEWDSSKEAYPFEKIFKITDNGTTTYYVAHNYVPTKPEPLYEVGSIWHSYSPTQEEMESIQEWDNETYYPVNSKVYEIANDGVKKYFQNHAAVETLYIPLTNTSYYHTVDVGSTVSLYEKSVIEVVGNGKNSIAQPSNARVLDVKGNEYLAGDVYVGCNDDSTGGTKLAKISDIPSVPVQNVKVNNTSILDQNGVANIPVASANDLGVVKTGAGLAIGSDNKLKTQAASESYIKGGDDANRVIAPYNQHQSIFYGLAKLAGVDLASETVTLGTYPVSALIAIQKMLGVYEAPWELIREVTTTEDQTEIKIDTDSYGESFKLSELIAIFSCGQSTTGARDSFYGLFGYRQNGTTNDTATSFPSLQYNTASSVMYAKIHIKVNVNAPVEVDCIIATGDGNTQNMQGMAKPNVADYLNYIKIYQSSATKSLIPSGANVKLYGRRIPI